MIANPPERLTEDGLIQYYRDTQRRMGISSDAGTPNGGMGISGAI